MDMSVANEKFLSLTTYRMDGSAKELPVWIVDLEDGTMGFTTNGDTYKCRRIRNNNKITLQPCNQRGAVTAGTEVVSGTAVLAQGADFDRVRSAIKKKYGFMANVIVVVNKIGGLFGKRRDSDTAVIITLD